MTQIDQLIDIIGAEKLQALIDVFGGTAIYVPVEMPKSMRNNEIHTLFSESLKSTTTMNAYMQCSEQFGLSVRQIQNIIKSAYSSENMKSH